MVLCALCATALATGDNCNGQPNQLPLYTDEPTLLRTVPNGKLFITGANTSAPFIPSNANYVRPYIIHVYGSPYDMGKAHGQLLKNEILEVSVLKRYHGATQRPRSLAWQIYSDFLEYVYSEVDTYIHFLPKWLRDVIEKVCTVCIAWCSAQTCNRRMVLPPPSTSRTC